jgi:hypothetical protein
MRYGPSVGEVLSHFENAERKTIIFTPCYPREALDCAPFVHNLRSPDTEQLAASIGTRLGCVRTVRQLEAELHGLSVALRRVAYLSRRRFTYGT